MPKAGAIRSYYCCRSHRDKYNRWKKAWKNGRDYAKHNQEMGRVVAGFLAQADQISDFQIALLDLMGFIHPTDQTAAARLIRQMLEAFRIGSTMG